MKFVDAVERILELEGGLSETALKGINVKKLTLDQVKSIYWSKYWRPLKASELPENIRLPLFDCAIDQGLTTAIKILQEILEVKQDGIVGDITIKTANKFKGDLKTIYLLKRAERCHQSLVYQVNGKDWFNRLIRVAC